MGAAQGRGGIGYDSMDSMGGDSTGVGSLVLGIAILIMLIGLGGAIGEAGKDKLQDLRERKIEKKIKRKIKRNQSEVTQEQRKNRINSAQTKEQNREDAVIAIQRKRLRAFNKK